MNKQQVIGKVKELGLPFGRYVVFGSAPMVLHGLRESKDIDLVVDSDLYQELKAAGWEERSFSSGAPYLVKDIFEAADSWNYGEYNPSVEELVQKAQIVEGVPFAPLEEVLAWKRAFGREKDLKDIQLIERFFGIQT